MKSKTKKSAHDAAEIPIGVVGIGIMGAVITASLLSAGHPVKTVSLDSSERQNVNRRVRLHLKALHDGGELTDSVDEVMTRLQVGTQYSNLAPCALVIESIIEDLEAKRDVIRNIEAVVSPQTLIGSNTSALPITQIQNGAKVPRRIFGLHWVSSSPFSWCVEVMGGAQTSRAVTRRACELVKLWGKKPALSRHDKRGFICNRIGYAILRESFALLDEGVATAEDIDNAVRASVGTWLPFVGPFGYLDLSGLPAYAPIMRDLLPDLSANDDVPATLQKLEKSGAKGIPNGRGFYRYSGKEGDRKSQDFDDFRRDLVQLIARYENTHARQKGK
jgi:3-hydroxybutyryl-CoA dehydrogenase